MDEGAKPSAYDPWPEEPLRGASPGASPLEWRVPAALLAVGLAVLLGSAFAFAGPAGAGALLLQIGVGLVVSIPVTLGAMFVVASVLKITFGPVGSAILKLAALSVFSVAVFWVGYLAGFPWAGYLVAVVAGWYLFSLLFDLDLTETVIALVLIGVIDWAVRALILDTLFPV